jgi:hypothetical protein
VPLVFGLFGRLRPPPALAARCGIVVRRRIHFPGRPFAWSRSGERCQGFSPLQPRCRFSVQHDSAGWRTQQLRTPCAHRLGEHTKRQRLGHVIVAPRSDSIASWQSSLVHRARAPHPSRTGLALTKAQDPTRLPRIRFLGPITNQLVWPTHHRGACAGLSTFACPEHPSAEDNDQLPRSGRLAFSTARLCASFGLTANPRTQRQDASNPFLQPTFRATSTHVETSPWETAAERRGKPADVRLPDRLLEHGRSWRSRLLGRRRTTLRSSGLQQLRA